MLEPLGNWESFFW